MSVSIDRARRFVYENGALWERALFAWLFDAGPLEHLQRCLLCYKNPDGGWGHGIEHDLKTPLSHPAALEFLLGALRQYRIPPGDMLAGTVAWLERQQLADGTLANPANLDAHPLAPWWREWGGQRAPDSVVGNLHALGLATPALLAATQQWALREHSPASIRANDWLFMAYHAHDYFLQIEDFPRLAEYRAATLDNIRALAAELIPARHYTLFHFAREPDAEVTRALPAEVIARCLDTLEATQRGDGGWADEHNLPRWQPLTTVQALLALRRFGRL